MVTTWLLACASAAWYRVRASSRTRNGSPPISSTSDCATAYPISSAAVTPKQVSGSRSMSSSAPVNVIAGWIASGMQSCSVSGASTPMPLAPDVCTMIVPGRTACVVASPDTRPASAASGTASRRSSARPATSSTGSIALSGSRRCARSRDACDIALHATTTCSARSNATPSAVPTRPAEMMPIVSRAGRNPSGVPMQTTSLSVKSVFVPVLRCGYRTVTKD